MAEPACLFEHPRAEVLMGMGDGMVVVRGPGGVVGNAAGRESVDDLGVCDFCNLGGENPRNGAVE